MITSVGNNKRMCTHSHSQQAKICIKTQDAAQ